MKSTTSILLSALLLTSLAAPLYAVGEEEALERAAIATVEEEAFIRDAEKSLEQAKKYLVITEKVMEAEVAAEEMAVEAAEEAAQK